MRYRVYGLIVSFFCYMHPFDTALIQEHSMRRMLQHKFDNCFVLLIKKQYKDFLQCIAQHNIDINDCQLRGNTFLSYAAYRGDVDAIEFLIAHGGDINIYNLSYKTPLYYAIYNKHEHAVRLLLGYKVNIEPCFLDGSTALACAVESGDLCIVTMIAQHISRHALELKHDKNIINIAVGRAVDARILDALLNAGFSPNVASMHRQTPLIMATFSSDFALVKALLKAGAYVLTTDLYGKTACDIKTSKAVCALLTAVKNWELYGDVVINDFITWKDWLSIAACAQIKHISRHTIDLAGTAFYAGATRSTMKEAGAIVEKVVACALKKNRFYLLYDVIKYMLPSLYVHGKYPLQQKKYEVEQNNVRWLKSLKRTGFTKKDELLKIFSFLRRLQLLCALRHKGIYTDISIYTVT